MDSLQLIGIVACLSLLAGWRLYAVLLAVGLGVRFAGFEFIGLPGSFGAMHQFGTPAVLAGAVIAAATEMLADKLPRLAPVWNRVHALLRPLGGALLALALAAPDGAVMTAVTLLLGGGAALLGHVAKAASRARIGAAGGPLRNLATSAGEDVATAAALALVIVFPASAPIIALLLLVLAVWVCRTWRR